MARILLSYGVHKHEAFSSRLAPLVKSRLEELGHEVSVVKRKDSNISNALKLSMLLGVFSLLKSSRGKRLLTQSLPEPLIQSVRLARREFAGGRLNMEKAAKLYSKLKRGFTVTEKQRQKLSSEKLKRLASKKSLLRNAAMKSFFNQPDSHEEKINAILDKADFVYRKRLSNRFRKWHVFDLHNSIYPAHEIGQKFDVLKPAAHLTGGYPFHDASQIEFIHQSRDASDYNSFFSYNKEPEFKFVTIEVPAAGKPSKNFFQKFARYNSSGYAHRYLSRHVDVKETEKLVPVKEAARIIAEGISSTLNGQVIPAENPFDYLP